MMRWYVFFPCVCSGGWNSIRKQKNPKTKITDRSALLDKGLETATIGSFFAYYSARLSGAERGTVFGGGNILLNKIGEIAKLNPRMFHSLAAIAGLVAMFKTGEGVMDVYQAYHLPESSSCNNSTPKL